MSGWDGLGWTGILRELFLERALVEEIGPWLTKYHKSLVSENNHRFFPLETRNHQESKLLFGASLVAQWLRICLTVQGIRVRALVWEDPTCRGATGPVSHNH